MSVNFFTFSLTLTLSLVRHLSYLVLSWLIIFGHKLLFILHWNRAGREISKSFLLGFKFSSSSIYSSFQTQPMMKYCLFLKRDIQSGHTLQEGQNMWPYKLQLADYKQAWETRDSLEPELSKGGSKVSIIKTHTHIYFNRYSTSCPHLLQSTKRAPFKGATPACQSLGFLKPLDHWCRWMVMNL